MVQYGLDASREALPFAAMGGEGFLAACGDVVGAPPPPVCVAPAASHETVVFEPS